jgi:hypothetical protein
MSMAHSFGFDNYGYVDGLEKIDFPIYCPYSINKDYDKVKEFRDDLDEYLNHFLQKSEDDPPKPPPRVVVEMRGPDTTKGPMVAYRTVGHLNFFEVPGLLPRGPFAMAQFEAKVKINFTDPSTIERMVRSIQEGLEFHVEFDREKGDPCLILRPLLSNPTAAAQTNHEDGVFSRPLCKCGVRLFSLLYSDTEHTAYWCPACGRAMTREHYSDKPDKWFEVGECPTCGASLVDTFEKGNPDGNLTCLNCKEKKG